MFDLKNKSKTLCLWLVFGILQTPITQAAANKATPHIHPSTKHGERSPAKVIVNRAHELLETPYRWGGNSVSQGFDCSGLMVYLFQSEAGVRLPRTTSAMHNVMVKSLSRKNLRPGDLVFFKINRRGRINHVGLYIGKNKFIHAPRRGKKIRIDSLNNNYWRQKFVNGKRLLNINRVKTNPLNRSKATL
jgi:cell wall-associated NlpC family hydrolase